MAGSGFCFGRLNEVHKQALGGSPPAGMFGRDANPLYTGKAVAKCNYQL